MATANLRAAGQGMDLVLGVHQGHGHGEVAAVEVAHRHGQGAVVSHPAVPGGHGRRAGVLGTVDVLGDEEAAGGLGDHEAEDNAVVAGHGYALPVEGKIPPYCLGRARSYSPSPGAVEAT